MSITVTKLGENVEGNQRKTFGKYVLDSGDTTGDINTGLHHVEMMQLTATGSSIVADAPTINEDLSSPIDGSAVTIIATANSSGYWVAWGA